MPSPVKRSSESVLESEVPSKANQIGLGLPSRVVFRRNLRLQDMSLLTRSSLTTTRRLSQEYPDTSFIVTEPSFGPSSYSRVQSVASSNHFLKPSQFAERSLYDIVEVPTPSSTSSSPCGTPSSRNQWSSPFTRLNPPQKKKKSFRIQLSAPPTGSPHDDATEVAAAAINVDPLLSEVPKAPAGTARPGFKRYVSKLRGFFKRSRSLKTSDDDSVSSPALVEHPDAVPGLEFLRQDDNHGGAKEIGLTPSTSHNLQFLF